MSDLRRSRVRRRGRRRCRLVLGLVYLGGWWLFGLAASPALVALHELYVMAAVAAAARARAATSARSRRCSARSSADPSGCSAASCSTLAARVPALRHRRDAPVRDGGDRAHGARRGLDRLRARATCSCSATSPSTGASPSSPSCSPSSPATRPRTSSGALLGRHKLAPAISPGKTWEGFVAGTLAAIARRVLRPLRRRTSSRSRESLVLGAAIALAAAARRPVRVGAQARPAGEGHGPAARRPRRRARPDRLAALRRPGGLLRGPRLRA